MSKYDDGLTDGKYTMKIDEATFKISGSGNPMLVYWLLIEDGEHTGKHVKKFSMLTERAQSITLNELTKLGVKAISVDEAADNVGKAVGAIVEVTRRTKGEYTNYYFDRVIKHPAAVMVEDVFGNRNQDDDIPF